MATLGDVNQGTAAPEAQLAHTFRQFVAEQLCSWGLPIDPARQIVAELSAP